MKKEYKVSLKVVLLFTLLAALYSCEVSGPDADPDDSDDQVTKTLVVENEDGDELSDFTVYDGGLENEGCSGEEISAEITREAGTELSVCIQADGYEPTDQTITFDKDGEIIITLTKEDGGNGGGNSTVTRSYEIRASGADTLVASDLRRSDTGEILNDGSASGEITLPRQDEAVELCSQPTYFKEGCETIVPTDDSGLIIIYVDRESVSVTVHTEDGSGSDIAASITVEDRGDSYTYDVDAGERTRDFPARSGSRTVRASKEGYNPDEETITAGADVETTLVLTRTEEKAACSDDRDNDGDGKIDEEDEGCVDMDGNYDPDDDVERLEGWKRIFGGESTIKISVSGKEGNREIERIPSYVSELPSSIQKAVYISIESNILVSADQTGEAFLFESVTGPSDDNLHHRCRTDIVPDDGSDGWTMIETSEIPRSCFQYGTSYKILAIHKSKVDGLSPTDGNDDIVFALPKDENNYFAIKWFYEPEEVNSQSKARQLQTRQFDVASPINGMMYSVHQEPIGEQELYRR